MAYFSGIGVHKDGFQVAHEQRVHVQLLAQVIHGKEIEMEIDGRLVEIEAGIEEELGRVRVRVNDNGGIVHAVVGKMSFDAQKLKENIDTFIHFVLNLKPNSVKGHYVKSVALCGTMSPSVRVAL